MKLLFVITHVIAKAFKCFLRHIYWIYRLSKIQKGKEFKFHFPIILEGRGKVTTGNNFTIEQYANLGCGKNAKLIFMDEPTSGLDPKATDEFSKIVLRLGEQGKAVLMATHDIFNAVNIGTHIGIMKDGQLIHSLQNSDINPNQLQKLYLETI